MGLYQKHRPSTLKRLMGNDNTKATLNNLLSNKETCPHAFFLHGSTGCGKTTVARIIAAKLGAKGNDYKEIDSADFRGIDMVREIRKHSGFRAIEGDSRVWVIDECHKLTGDAQNALLKLLEDPPSHVYLVLCTTEPQKVIETIKGRCSIFQLKPLEHEEMMELLIYISTKEEQEVDNKVLEVIARDSLGRPRNAINILEQVLQAPEEKRLKIAERVAEEQAQGIELCRALIKSASWNQVNKILLGLKDQEPEQLRRMVVGYMSNTLLKTDNRQAAFVLEEFLDPFYDTGFPQLVHACYIVTKK